MPQPSPLTIATSALVRLDKERAAYQKEISVHKTRVSQAENAEDEDGNKDYIINQEKRALQETERMIPELDLKIKLAAEGIELQLDDAAEGEASETDITRAMEVLATIK